MSAIENGQTSRVVFGSQTANIEELSTSGWSVHNPMEFLSTSYFDRWNEGEDGGMSK